MAISWVGSGAEADFGSTAGVAFTANVPFPATVAAGDIAFIVITTKPSIPSGTTDTSVINTPTGWTVVGSSYGGGYGPTEQGGGTGNVGNIILSKILAGTEGGTTQTVDISSVNSGTSRMSVFRNGTGSWNTDYISGDITANSPTVEISSTFSSAYSFITGDHILYGSSRTDDVFNGGVDFSAHSFTQTGSTFAAVTEIAEDGSGGGNDSGMFCARTNVTSGGGSTAPTMNFTVSAINSRLERGPTFAVVLRETIAGAVNSTIAATDTSLGVVSSTTGSVTKGIRALLRDTDTSLPVSNLTGLRVSIRSASNSAALLLAAVVDETTDGSGYIEISLEGVSVNINDYVYVTIEKSDLSIVNTYRLQVIGI